MGRQVIKQPDGLLAVFSSNSGRLILWNATQEEVIADFVEDAAAQAETKIRRVVEAIDRGEQERVYYQFAMTWEEALRDDREHCGVASRDFDIAAQASAGVPR